MHHGTRSITWQGQSFQFEGLRLAPSKSSPPLWAVYRRGEFIGTMPSPAEVTTKEFEVRGMQWLAELLGRQGALVADGVARDK
jgi:hypothetical protein